MIKLFHVNTLSDGTKRLQSQLLVGKDSADFIQTPDGKIKSWDNGKNGFDFYPFNKPYKIVSDIPEMKTQQL